MVQIMFVKYGNDAGYVCRIKIKKEEQDSFRHDPYIVLPNLHVAASEIISDS